ncbi:nucleoside phosphorylase domain-containing protein [Aspergillus heterothallicus]
MAIRALFGYAHGDLAKHESDTNTYALGSPGGHNVVASDMDKSFPAVRWHFVVGIGGAAPSDAHDIRLGDVVVSTSRPARSLMTAINLVRSDPYHSHDFLQSDIERIVALRPEYKDPGENHDILFEPHSTHKPGNETCINCTGLQITSETRSPGPRTHYGRIASGNQVIKDALTRDRIAKKLNAICFEMEGAGVMTTGHCLVIRGICDYADSHKNDHWHNYAAATAAAYTKFFLLRLTSLDVLSREMVQLPKRIAPDLDLGESLVKRLRYEE